MNLKKKKNLPVIKTGVVSNKTKNIKKNQLIYYFYILNIFDLTFLKNCETLY
jgi:hypothetical protein